MCIIVKKQTGARRCPVCMFHCLSVMWNIIACTI